MPRKARPMKRGRKPQGSTTTLKYVKNQPYIAEGVSLYLHHTTKRYYVGVYNSKLKKVEFRSLHTMNLKEAVELARTVYAVKKQVDDAAARLEAMSGNKQVETLQQAFEIALNRKLMERKLNPEQEAITKRHWSYFKAWMEKNAPSVTTWLEVTDTHVEAYIASLRFKAPKRGPRVGADGMKPASISRYTHPITMTSKAMNRLKPELYRVIKVNHLIPRSGREPKKYLTVEQAVKLYVWAKTNCRHNKQYAVLAIALGCFAGLRIKEVAALTSGDVTDGALTVRASKTDAGRRVVPLTKLAHEAWTDYMAALHPIPIAAASITGVPYTRISYKVKELLKQAAVALNDPDYARCSPREALRKTFANLMEEADVPEKYQRALFGHATPDSILHEHYREDPAILPDDMEHVKQRKLQRLRERAVVFMDTLIETFVENAQKKVATQ
jgi:integrase